jgi:signal transduction histidine kinase
MRAEPQAGPASAMNGSWAATVAHELKQPVAVIDMVTSVLGAALEQPERFARAIEVIRSATAQLRRFAADLDDPRQAAYRQFRLRPRSCDLHALVRATVDASEHLVSRDRLRIFVLGGAWRFRIDPMRIRQVLTNLLSNASKYAERGSSVDIRLRRYKRSAAISVVSRGPNLEPEALARLFEPYYRTPAARAQGAAGSGLGLFITKTIVEAHGGRMTAHCTDGVTTFRFWLPARLAVSGRRRRAARASVTVHAPDGR